MAFGLFKILKGLLIRNDADETKQLELSVSNSATTAKKMTISSAHTDNRTITLPDSTATLATTTDIVNLQTSSYDINNISLTSVVNQASSHALTISLNDQSGNNFTASSIGKIGFQYQTNNGTAYSGRYYQTLLTSTVTSLTISNGSTLGHLDATAAYIYVYLLYISNTEVELAVSSKIFDDGTVVSTTAEGGAGAAKSATIMYSATARSNYPCRLIGRLKSTQSTAGVWDTNISETTLIPFNKITSTYLSNWTSFTPTGSWSTNTTYTGMYRRVGDTMEVSYKLALAGAPTSASLTVNIPSGYTIDTTKICEISDTSIVKVGHGSLWDYGSGVYNAIIGVNGTTNLVVSYTDDAAGGVILNTVTQAAPFTFANNDKITFTARVPIVEWDI